MIWKASEHFEDATSYLGRGLNDGIKGATLDAIGSSLPELFVALVTLLLYADREGFAFAIGVTAGSAMFNAAIIPAVVMIVVFLQGRCDVIEMPRATIFRDSVFLLSCEGLLIVCLDGDLTILDGVALLAAYCAYLSYLTWEHFNGDTPSGW